MANHVQPLTIQGIEYGTARAHLSHSDLTAAAATETLTFADLLANHPRGSLVPANAVLVDAEVNLITEFSGGAAATAVLTMGDAADPDELLTGVDVFTGAGAGITKKNGALVLPAFEATAYAAQVTLTITGDTVDNLVAGEAELRIIYRASSLDSEVA